MNNLKADKATAALYHGVCMPDEVRLTHTNMHYKHISSNSRHEHVRTVVLGPIARGVAGESGASHPRTTPRFVQSILSYQRAPPSAYIAGYLSSCGRSPEWSTPFSP